MVSEQSNFDQFNSYDQVPAIYTMPEKFLPKQKIQKNKSGKGIIIFLYFLIAVVLIGAGFAVWFLFLRQEPEVIEQPKVIPQVNITNPTSTPAVQEEITPVEVKFVARDAQGNEFSHVLIKLTDVDTELAEKIKVTSLLPEQMTGRASRAIGAIYLFTIEDSKNLSRPTTFIFSYTEPDNLTSKKENSLQLAEEISPGTWKYLAGSKLDIVANTISIELSSFPQGQVTILSNLEEEENFDFYNPLSDEQPQDNDILVTTPLSSTLDSDNDGLTDVEEQLYKSNPSLPDTDGDGFLDGQEVINKYSPISADSLLAAGLVNEYKNDDMKISLFYPSSWTVRIGNAETQSVSFESSGDDFIQISIQDNPDNLDVYAWYSKLAPNIDQTLLAKTTIAGLDAIYSPDMANLYVAQNNKIYILTYSAGLKTQVDYLTTFAMMQASLNFLTNGN